MHTPHEQAIDRDDLFEEITVANVEDHRADRPRTVITLSVSHPDLSVPFPVAAFGVYGSLRSVLETLEANLSEVLGTMEVRVPEAGGPPLPSVGVWGPVYSARLAVALMVSDRENW